MLQLNKAETKFWYLTLNEKTTILNPYYLFSLKHRLTAVTYNFILTDSSSYTDRYNKFEITEGTTITLDAGEYEYKIYAQTSDTNTDPSLANELVERGIVKVDFDPTAATQYTVELNEKIYEVEAPPDADYQAVLNYAVEQGYTIPSEAQQLLQISLIKDLKTIGAWEKMEQFFYFQNDGSIEFASIDWKDPSGNQMDFTNAPTFVSGYGISIPSRLNGISSTKVESDSGESQSVNDREFGMLFYDNEPRTSIGTSTPSRYGNGYTNFRGGTRIDSQFYATNSFISSTINATDTYDFMSFSRDNEDYKFRFYQEGVKYVNYTRFANEYPANGSISSTIGIATEYMRNFQGIYGGRCLTDSIRDVFYEKMRFYLDKLKP